VDIAFGLLRSVGTGGNLTTGAQLAALALEYDAEIHSNDTDFGRFPGLRWSNPLAG
jgi:predicted nucleic acid-binding protein